MQACTKAQNLGALCVKLSLGAARLVFSRGGLIGNPCGRPFIARILFFHAENAEGFS
jgi:hypothetical protein